MRAKRVAAAGVEGCVAGAGVSLLARSNAADTPDTPDTPDAREAVPRYSRNSGSRLDRDCGTNT